ncbi:MAG: hypothetical protein QF824_00885 [Candidatus Woesearchaeota archaeon]|nr:hypothetical protein [Candidatus Woesearchaeota archaeon]
MNIKYLVGVVILLVLIGCQSEVNDISGAAVVDDGEVVDAPKEVVSEEVDEVVVEEKIEAEPEAEEVIIKMEGGSFEPDKVVVSVGTTVTWFNNDRRPHTIMDKSRRFRSGRTAPGDSYSFTFTEAGIYNYQDVVFYTIVGKVVVKN